AKQLDEIKAHSDWVVAVAISPDGKTVASGGKDGMVRLWEVSTRKKRAEYGKTGHGWVNCVAFSCGGRYLATGTTLATVQVWDLAKAKEYRSLVGHEGAISSVNFSPDGHKLLSGSEDTTALTWDVSGLNSRKLLEADETHSVNIDTLWSDL